MTNSDTTFKDPDLERAFTREGYVVVPGLVADDVEWWHQLYADVHPTDALDGARSPFVAPAETPEDWRDRPWPGEYFLTGIDEIDPANRSRLDAAVRPRWEKLASEVFTEHHALATSFLMKWPGDDGVLPLHQDPTVVDEREHQSATVWLALDDTSAELDNGPLYVIPGSHIAGAEVRGAGTVPTYINKLDRLWAQTIPISMRAGDALILDARIIHGSPPNRAATPRLAVAGVFAPRRAAVVHAVVATAGGEEVHLFEVGSDFYRSTSPRALREDPPSLDDRSILATVPIVTQALVIEGCVDEPPMPIERAGAEDPKEASEEAATHDGAATQDKERSRLKSRTRRAWRALRSTYDPG